MDSQAAAAALTAARLLRLRLATQQPAVLFFLLVTAFGCAGLSYFPLNSSAYFWAYLLSQGVSDVIAIAVVSELFSTIVAGYPGIQTAARWVLNGAISVSVTASLIIIFPMWGAAPDSSHLFYILELHRSLVFSLAVIIISLLLFLSHYPLRLQKNSYTLCYFFSAIVLIDATDTLVATMDKHMFSRWVDMGTLAATALCFVGWAILMRREEPLPARNITYRTSKEDELLQQLESLNRTLSRVARR